MTVRKLIKKWQKILRLQDYDIDVERTKFDGNEIKLGEIGVDWQNRRATMLLLCDKQLKELKGEGYDEDLLNIEHTIVHELLHIYFMTGDDAEGNLLIEQGINHIASLLIKQYKEG